MVIDRLRQTGGEIAVRELKEKFSVVDTPPQTETETETEKGAVEEDLEEPIIPDEPLPQEGHESHEQAQEPQAEKPGPSEGLYEDMAKMEMAHEIVMNSDYKIEKKQSEGYVLGNDELLCEIYRPKIVGQSVNIFSSI